MREKCESLDYTQKHCQINKKSSLTVEHNRGFSEPVIIQMKTNLYVSKYYQMLEEVQDCYAFSAEKLKLLIKHDECECNIGNVT